jgi:hypothetical protein
MSARFLKGDKVWMTSELAKQGWNERRGIVSKDQRSETSVSVRIVGQKSSASYASRFWRRVRDYPPTGEKP